MNAFTERYAKGDGRLTRWEYWLTARRRWLGFRVLRVTDRGEMR